MPNTPLKLLDLFCGVGGWSNRFAQRGWMCFGVDMVDLGYPYAFVQADVLTLDREWINDFGAVVASPPCEEFARAWLPWLRGDKAPSPEALDLLRYSVRLCQQRPFRLCECSRFAARHMPGYSAFGSYALWGDVPALMVDLPALKQRKSGKAPELRSEIPIELSEWIAHTWTQKLTNQLTTPRTNP